MKITLKNNIYKLYTPEQAESVAKELCKGDEDGWTYKANHDPNGNGMSFIEVFDEESFLVGRY